jgi:RND family efflux transporter MFP subunit
VAAAQVHVAAADAERARTLLAYLNVTAPFDGVVTRRLANVGDLVQNAAGGRGAMPLFTCQKIDIVRVSCEVPDVSAAAVRPGTRADVRLTGPGGASIPASITRVAISVDPATRTMRAEIQLPNPDERIRPGMYAQVTLYPQPGAAGAGRAADAAAAR